MTNKLDNKVEENYCAPGFFMGALSIILGITTLVYSSTNLYEYYTTGKIYCALRNTFFYYGREGSFLCGLFLFMGIMLVLVGYYYLSKYLKKNNII